MAANYVLLEKITVGAAGAASVTFNNIPQTGYTDLKIVATMRTSEALGANSIWINFNGSSAGFSAKVLEGSGTAASSYSQAKFVGTYEGTSFTANTFSNTEIYIPNYTSANYKSYSADSVTENNGTAAYSELTAGLWSNTAAISSITLYSGSNGTMVQYSTFSLYGLAAVGATPAIDPKATGGDIIQTDGTYWYHAFLSSGTFTPKVGLTCDILQVAGGGGGGYWNAGGGGAGGVTYSTSQSLASGTAQTIAIGAGGAGSTADGVKGTNGATTQFGSLTAIAGGGGGGSDNSADGAAGASGGGGAGISSGSSAGGTASNGSTGGAGRVGAPYTGGGGGGFGGAGATGAASGNGGIGTSTYNTSLLTPTGLGVSGYIAAGGGGGIYNTGTPGAGGSGGGGNGGNTTSTNGIAATANTGSGGGGACYPGNGGNGASGLVIIRYAI